MFTPRTPREPQPFSIYFLDGIVVADWAGSPTPEWVRAAMEEAVGHPDFFVGMPFLAMVPSEIAPPNTGQIMAMASEMAVYRDRIGPMALVIGSQLQYGLARMLSAYCSMSGIRLDVFAQVQDAFAFLRREMECNPRPPRPSRERRLLW